MDKLDHQVKKLFEQHQFGKVALLTDSTHIKSSEEILSILQKQNIDTHLIIVPGDIKVLVDVSIWQNFSRVFINLPYSHVLSSGYIQGLLDLLSLDYTGSGMVASALANNRLMIKKIWQVNGISTTNFLRWRPNINWQEIAGLFGFPMAVKSIYSYNHTIFKVMNIEQLQEATENFCNVYDIIFEPWVTGDRYVVYIVGDKVLLPVCIDEVLKDNPNQEDSCNAECYVNRMQKLAIDAFVTIGGQGLAKVNIIMDVNKDCWVSSIDPCPLIMANNSFSKAADNSSISFESIIKHILMTSFIKKCNHTKLNFFSDFNKYFNTDGL